MSLSLSPVVLLPQLSHVTNPLLRRPSKVPDLANAVAGKFFCQLPRQTRMSETSIMGQQTENNSDRGFLRGFP
jgi:hypothetical protein